MTHDNLNFNNAQPVTNNPRYFSEPYSPAPTPLPTPDTLEHHASSKINVDDEQFVEALERCLHKSIYDDYTYLPRWALWS